jgi:hypothetical protein
MCDRAQPRFLFLEPKIGVDVNDTEAFVVVWESVKSRGSISDNVLDETVSNSAILALGRRHIGNYCKDGRACRAPKQRDREPLHLEAGPIEGASSVILFQPPGWQKRPMIFGG